MHDGWRRVSLGSVLAQRREPIIPTRGSTYAQLTLAINGNGARRRRTLSGEGALASRQFRVRAGDLIVSKIDARKGAVAVIPRELDGAIVTADFPTFEINTTHAIPAYLDLVVRTPSFAALADSISAGTTNRVRIDLARFPELEIDLPPLAEQRRIVDLVGAVDDLAECAANTLAATERTLSSYLDAWFANAQDEDVVTVGSLATLGSGPSWKADDESPIPGDGLLPVVGIPSTPSGSRVVDVTRRVFVRGLSPTVRTLTGDSLLLIRTNGNRSRIGNVYRVPESAVGHAFSAFQIGASLTDPANSAYLFWFLSAPSVQRRITSAASGTTGLGNVAVRWLSRLEVPWPDEQRRRMFVTVADSLEAVSAACRAVLTRLGAARMAMLADLLSGEHEIPASYDRFLDGVA